MGSPVESDPVIRRALLAVHDKTGLVELARALERASVELLATSGTHAFLAQGGIRARPAEELTGIGSWFAGRIKTLHPGLLGGILAPRTKEGVAELSAHGLLPIDLVVVNLYPFEAHWKAEPGSSNHEEFIDVGGVTLLRAAAKNHDFVAAVSSPTQYEGVTEELAAHGGRLSGETRRTLAMKAFERTADYDGVIAAALGPTSSGSLAMPQELTLRREPAQLRYGENPHQKAAIYRWDVSERDPLGHPEFELIKGEALSYTNLLDLDTALGIVSEFERPAAAITKHANPCGAASAETAAEALARAVATDPVARYGCAIALNRTLTAEDAEPLRGVFVDLLAAPAFETDALERLTARPKIKLVRIAPFPAGAARWELRSAVGRVLLEQVDQRILLPGDLRQVTRAAASERDLAALSFAWKVVRHARSNAIVLADGSATVGIGAGQPVRLRSVELAIGVAGERARGSVLASDAFFPFADGVEAAGTAGVRAILQPGGSIRDAEVIAAADRHGIAMYCTGWRVFRH
ncbi:MAG: bifunctional phosphoribosylaminoimidazolecarboxamide formyltransferase/IMP cyclohydrolase [Thermoplasmata archaeon]|nr:bifunctional phosphoribosylaminoimidazolecarboxamide formyltransferase/IMP cyclohydrolase [Thermoplasmata archaeon]